MGTGDQELKDILNYEFGMNEEQKVIEILKLLLAEKIYLFNRLKLKKGLIY